MFVLRRRGAAGTVGWVGVSGVAIAAPPFSSQQLDTVATKRDPPFKRPVTWHFRSKKAVIDKSVTGILRWLVAHNTCLPKIARSVLPPPLSCGLSVTLWHCRRPAGEGGRGDRKYFYRGNKIPNWKSLPKCTSRRRRTSQQWTSVRIKLPCPAKPIGMHAQVERGRRMSSRDNGQGQGRFLNACWVLRGGREKNDALAAHNSLLPPTHGQSKNPPHYSSFPGRKRKEWDENGPH